MIFVLIDITIDSVFISIIAGTSISTGDLICPEMVKSREIGRDKSSTDVPRLIGLMEP